MSTTGFALSKKRRLISAFFQSASEQTSADPSSVFSPKLQTSPAPSSLTSPPFLPSHHKSQSSETTFQDGAFSDTNLEKNFIEKKHKRMRIIFDDYEEDDESDIKLDVKTRIPSILQPDNSNGKHSPFQSVSSVSTSPSLLKSDSKLSVSPFHSQHSSREQIFHNEKLISPIPFRASPLPPLQSHSANTSSFTSTTPSTSSCNQISSSKSQSAMLSASVPLDCKEHHPSNMPMPYLRRMARFAQSDSSSLSHFDPPSAVQSHVVSEGDGFSHISLVLTPSPTKPKQPTMIIHSATDETKMTSHSFASFLQMRSKRRSMASLFGSDEDSLNSAGNGSADSSITTEQSQENAQFVENEIKTQIKHRKLNVVPSDVVDYPVSQRTNMEDIEYEEMDSDEDEDESSINSSERPSSSYRRSASFLSDNYPHSDSKSTYSGSTHKTMPPRFSRAWWAIIKGKGAKKKGTRKRTTTKAGTIKGRRRKLNK
ncbi:uncharacterized protein MONOS_15771 [Monocercomonoides exilis]|uniref:uncharacterized protein n=1 Tax=Monocercomonoides exilis TaxID=2049356 RepID=UPI00355A3008|nr:hypothetical protein MONOS_15771 [Monocercomonoides exilis]|eukprot:MONOS_15771.1-p1 / transcript=MONOS_15771.1 / gene=MONOS_15771 / organism=Monocercomonoides_exilis_PA203 / gene_product=unspecified product / transcript_product=unspecified product / location=Mono_scaffold01350:7262-8710(+) / protein_length=483 / sequence_SO=supercontig / SO=protein_coding / is_pseudo=false